MQARRGTNVSPKAGAQGRSPRLNKQQTATNPFANLPVKNVTYSNGATYDGQVNAMNQRHGKGILNFPNAEARYEGIFENGNLSKGKITYLGQSGGECWFDGTFKNGQWHKGKYMKGQAMYEGIFHDQQMNGKFTVTWPSGVKYVGQLQNNKLHGEGVMTFKEGNIAEIKGTWEADNLVKSNLLTMRDGSTATNYDPATGKLVGEGFIKTGGCTFTGIWSEDGVLNGEGIVENLETGGSFKGQFEDNLRNGPGRYVWPNNQGEYTGEYKNGLRHTGPDGPDATMV